MTVHNSTRPYHPALEGLRGLAILLVVLYHNFNFFPYFNYGWLGVDLFFVLSGFLITDILFNTINTQNYFKNFYARRTLRIFPLYYLSLLLFLIILPALPGFPLDMSYYQKNQWWFWTYLQNWTLIFRYNPSSNALNHFWSLAVEEQYYLLWPFVIAWIKRPKRLLLFCLVALVAVIAARLYISGHKEFFPRQDWLFLFTRIDGLLIGSSLAIIYNVNPNIIRKYSTALILALAAFNFIIYFIHKDPDFPVWGVAGYTTFAAIFALLVYEAVKTDDKIVQFVFTSAPLRFLGKYSYGFYIFHWPIFLLSKPCADRLTANWLQAGTISFQFASATLATLVGLFVSLLSYHLFEKHFLKLKKQFV